MKNQIYSAILFFAFVGVLMAWPDRKESFRGNIAEREPLSWLSEIEQNSEEFGYEETLAGSIHDLLVENLPSNGPWFVTMNVELDPGEYAYIRESPTGAIHGYAINNSATAPELQAYSASGVITGTSFYIQMSFPPGARRYNVTWQLIKGKNIGDRRDIL